MMGMFTGVQKSAGSAAYEDLKKYLKPRDGKIHVAMINSFSKYANKGFQCENKYTTEIDEILSCMQSDGYEIVDIKFDSLLDKGVVEGTDGFHTLIMYK